MRRRQILSRLAALPFLSALPVVANAQSLKLVGKNDLGGAVVSVGLLTLPGKTAAAARDYVVISDVNSGIYVLDAPWSSAGLKR